MLLKSTYATAKQLKENGYIRKKRKIFWHQPQGTFCYAHPKEKGVYYYQWQTRKYKRMGQARSKKKSVKKSFVNYILG